MIHYARALLRMLAEICGATLIILALAGGLCLLSGQPNLRAFSMLTQDLGLVALALGGLSLIGAASIGRNSNYQVARTASAANIRERTQQDMSDGTRRLEFIVITSGAGAVALLVGLCLWIYFV